MREDHEGHMRECLGLAWQARQKGNHPFAALLVHNNQVVLQAENSVETDQDQTRHAELNLVSAAWRQFDPQFLGQATLYASTEPCAMCAGAIYWAGISTVVFSCSTQSLNQNTQGGLHISSREIFARGSHRVRVIGPILEQDGLRVHQDFW